MTEEKVMQNNTEIDVKKAQIQPRHEHLSFALPQTVHSRFRSEQLSCHRHAQLYATLNCRFPIEKQQPAIFLLCSFDVSPSNRTHTKTLLGLNFRLGYKLSFAMQKYVVYIAHIFRYLFL